MAVSDVKVYFQRKYRVNDEWYTEEERPACQLYNGLTFPEAYYQAYCEAEPLGSGFSGAYNTYLGAYGSYASYKPGQCYIPKDTYYTIHDFFTSAEISIFFAYVREEFSNNDDAEKFVFKSPSGNIFWQNEDGINLIPVFQLIMDKPTSVLPRRRYIFLTLSMMTTKLDPNDIYCRSDGTMYTVDEEHNMTTLIYGTHYDTLSVGVRGICSGEMVKVGAPNPTKKDLENGILRFQSQLEKAKFYILYTNNSNPFYSVKYDDIAYYRSNLSITSYKNYFGFLVDVSDCPYHPVKGFYSWNMNLIENFLSVIDRTDGGPDANDPGEEDDPYEDEDDGDDEGGNGDHDDTDDPIDPPSLPPISATSVGLVNVYNPTSSQLGQIATKLWSTDFIEIFKQYFTSPMEAILGLSIIPVKPSIAGSKNVYFGLYDTNVSAPIVDTDYVIIDCGSISINRYWGSYLDYDPYTKISCYLPYIGEASINPDQVMQKSLGILYYINVITGDTVAIITADDSVIMTAAGNCVRQLPLSQNDYSAIINTAISSVAALGLAVAGAASSGATLAAAKSAEATAEMTGYAVIRAAGANTASSANFLDSVVNAKNHYQHAGQIGTGSGQLAPQKPFLTIERPNLDLAENYKSYVGYPCNKTLYIGNCSGFTQVEASKISISGATDEEIAEIIEILARGVII